MDAITVPCTQEKIWDDQPDAGSMEAKDALSKPMLLAWRNDTSATRCRTCSGAESLRTSLSSKVSTCQNC
jgi:hypothetical protein